MYVFGQPDSLQPTSVHVRIFQAAVPPALEGNPVAFAVCCSGCYSVVTGRGWPGGHLLFLSRQEK